MFDPVGDNQNVILEPSLINNFKMRGFLDIKNLILDKYLKLKKSKSYISK